MLQEKKKRLGPLLVVVPSLNTSIEEDGRFRLTQKFVEGMRLTSSLWPGPTAAAMFLKSSGPSGNLDDVTYNAETLPFELRVINCEPDDIFSSVQDADVVQLGGDHRLRALPNFCERSRIPFVFVSEYTLRTCLQIIFADTFNPVLRMRRAIWAVRQEYHNRRAVRTASAVQCNGTPTYDIYSKIKTNTLLYFDSRIDKDMIAEAPSMASRVGSFDGNKPIRLAFSGRLNLMKGADDLIEVARILQEAKLPFVMDIFGDGPLNSAMHERIRRHSLLGKVSLKGVLNFSSELIPYIRDFVDLFVCCHRQGDPSCTSVETFACGVPIAGYANEALVGIIKRESVGWTVPMNDAAALARKVVELYNSPEEISRAAWTALAFARRHTFAGELKARIEQMINLIDNNKLC